MAGYPDDWQERSKQTYRRDSYECQRCGAKGGPFGETELHAHHRVPKSQGGGHDLDNLQTVCKSCHERIHGHRIPTNQSSTGETKGNPEGFLAFLLAIFVMPVVIIPSISIVKSFPQPIKGIFGVLLLVFWIHGSLKLSKIILDPNITFRGLLMEPNNSHANPENTLHTSESNVNRSNWSFECSTDGENSNQSAESGDDSSPTLYKCTECQNIYYIGNEILSCPECGGTVDERPSTDERGIGSDAS